MSVENWCSCVKAKIAQGLPFEDSKIRCATQLGRDISTVAIDSLTWGKITDLNDSELESRVISRILEYPHFSFDSTVEMARNSLKRDIQFKADAQKIFEKSRRAIAADKARIATDQAEREKEDQLEVRRQIDQQIATLKKANEPPPMKPHVIEKTYCGFCSEFHPTKIVLSCGRIREYPLSTWHVKDFMRVDQEGWITEQPKDIDRCIVALTAKGMPESEARAKCETMLSDSMFLNNFIRFPIKSGVTKPTKEDYAIGDTVAKMNIHPEMAKAMYDKDRKETTEYINRLAETGELQKMLRQRKANP